MDLKYESTARVVSVIDGYKFVINHGSEHGVESGENYLIFGLGNEITDPKTGENLGVLELVRGRARVIHVQENLSTLESSITKITPGKKRIVKRERNNFAMFSGHFGTEEIEEGREEYTAEINTLIGDYARPV